jgi:putative hemolysin
MIEGKIKGIVFVVLLIALAPVVLALKNPMAVYCNEMGYEYSDGMCIFTDGVSVNAAGFLLGVAGQKYSYCEKNGHILKAVNGSDRCSSIYSSMCSVCVLESDEEVEVTKLMGLSFLEGVCGDNICASDENFESCPGDCDVEKSDEYCDRTEDGKCDPDCEKGEDVDCYEKKWEWDLKIIAGVGVLILLLILGVLFYLRFKTIRDVEF